MCSIFHRVPRWEFTSGQSFEFKIAAFPAELFSLRCIYVGASSTISTLDKAKTELVAYGTGRLLLNNSEILLLVY
jgi:hypothetical protein